MMDSQSQGSDSARSRVRDFDHVVLALQGGGALGAYQAGVYEGMAEAGFAPNWIVGVSIGAINAALIAGNPPERRVARLREFWERMSSSAPDGVPAAFEPFQPFIARMYVANAMAFGIPGFFTPRIPPPFLAPAGTEAALSYYDTEPLNRTLSELADFDLINSKAVRLSLGAVNVRNAESVYFDNARVEIRPDHVRASGALPPGFPPVEIDGELDWDGGITSNSPLWYAADESAHKDVLIIQADVFNPRSAAPQTLEQAAERVKDIQYASKQRMTGPHPRARGSPRGVAAPSGQASGRDARRRRRPETDGGQRPALRRMGAADQRSRRTSAVLQRRGLFPAHRNRTLEQRARRRPADHAQRILEARDRTRARIPFLRGNRAQFVGRRHRTAARPV